MKRLGIAAVGLALVVGILVGVIVGNLFGATAQHTSAATVTGTGCYTNWNSADCAAGWTTVSTGEWTAVQAYWATGVGVSTGSIVCAAPKGESPDSGHVFSSETANQSTHPVSHEPCAICCGTGSASAVGGIAELPPLASAPGGSGMGGTTYAVLAGAAAGVLAFGVMGTLAVKKRGVR
jgi:hypothetical protein